MRVMCCFFVCYLMYFIKNGRGVNSLVLLLNSSASFINSSAFFSKFIRMKNTSDIYQK